MKKKRKNRKVEKKKFEKKRKKKREKLAKKKREKSLWITVVIYSVLCVEEQ
jgi:hypothetical protein